MKELLKQHGINVPIFQPVESASDIIQFVNQHRYPIVIKPRKGYSSVGTKIIRFEKDLEDFFVQGLGEMVDPPLDLEGKWTTVTL
jgi:biotin carboxylase